MQDFKKLGFGYMRLPLKDGKFDRESTNAMVDRFLECGFSYFDTAFVYEGSEDALRESLVERHPRDRYSITTKLAMFAVREPSDMRKQLETSMSRLGVSYIDYYFIHAMGGATTANADKFDAWSFLQTVKAEGLVRHVGFSFHGTPEELDDIFTRHPEVELVQLQINYLDWDSEDVRARECYEIARKHGKEISVMEPTKSGLLAGQDSAAGDVLKAVNPNVSVASWAFRFIWSLDGIKVALSGMENISQVEDNALTNDTFTPLTEAELAKLAEVAQMIRSTPRIPCTSCRYCVANCPQKIQIPMFMGIYNNMLVYKDTNSTAYTYSQFSMPGAATPADCVQCKSCEEHCPQHIEISKIMQDFSSKLGENRSKFRL